MSKTFIRILQSPKRAAIASEDKPTLKSAVLITVSAAGTLVQFIRPKAEVKTKVYIRSDRTEERIQYDSDGTMFAKEVCTYDHAGNLIRVEYYDSEETIWQTVLYSYIEA